VAARRLHSTVADAVSRVVVLGGTGFIGRHVRAALVRCAYDVRSLSSRDIDLAQGGSAARLGAHIDAETSVVMCSGITSTVGNTARSYCANRAMAVNLVRALRGQPARSVVFLSSTFVYGRRSRAVPIDEDEPAAPDCPYSRAKLASERLLCRLVAGPVTVLRLPGVYGPGDEGRSVVSGLAARIARREEAELVGGGRQLRDYVHVEDVAHLIACMVETPFRGVLNATSGEPIRIADLAALVSRVIGAPLRAVERPADGTVYDLTFDVRRLRRHYPDAVPAGVARRLPACTLPFVAG
jgi:dTDP-6-deoxy-L-talose 4-dehydrogenase [NAD(P)+]